MAMTSGMRASDVVELCELFENADIPVWLDGGWGVDALLGMQTRSHKDVDIVVALSDIPKLMEILRTKSFTVKAGKPPDSFVLADDTGREIDVHGVTFDAEGSGIYRMQNGEVWEYPAEGFSGQGMIGGTVIRCLSPEAQVLCHADGYTPTDKDFNDMELLERRFGVTLPPQLRRKEKI